MKGIGDWLLFLILFAVVISTIISCGIKGVDSDSQRIRLQALEQQSHALEIDMWALSINTIYDKDDIRKRAITHRQWHQSVYLRRLIQFEIKWNESYQDYCNRTKHEK